MDGIESDDIEYIAARSKLEGGAEDPGYKRGLGQIMNSINGIRCYNGDTRKMGHRETMKFIKDANNVNWEQTRKMREASAAEYFMEGSYIWDSEKHLILLKRESLRLRNYLENHLKWQNNYLFGSKAG